MILLSGCSASGTVVKARKNGREELVAIKQMTLASQPKKELIITEIEVSKFQAFEMSEYLLLSKTGLCYPCCCQLRCYAIAVRVSDDTHIITMNEISMEYSTYLSQ